MSDTPETDVASHLMQEAPNQWRAVVNVEISEKLERERNTQRHLAGELIAAIRVNAKRDTFVTSTTHELDEWLAPFVARLLPLLKPLGSPD